MAKSSDTSGILFQDMKKGILAFLIIGFVLFSLTPTFYELSRASDLQPNRSFELIHNFPTDYNFYLSRIRLGLEGKWTVHEVYTTEPHQGSFIHEMYLLMGRIGRSVHVPQNRPADVYHMARIVFALLLLWVIAIFCLRAFNSFPGANTWSVMSFLLIVTASSWPKLVFVEGVPRLGGYMAWWSVMDSLQRITFIPHLLVGQALMLGIVLAYMAKLHEKHSGVHIALGILGFVLGLIFPPGLIFVYATLGIMICLKAFMEKRAVHVVMTESMVPLLGFVCVSAPSLAYLFLMTSFYPWKRLAELDIIHPLPFDYVEYIKALGPVFPLGLVGLCIAVWKKERHMILAASWVIAWLVLLGIFHYVPSQSPLRFSEMVPHVGLGVLAMYTFAFGFHLIKGKRSLKQVGQFISLFVPIALIILGLFHMYSSYLWQKDFVDHKIRASIPLVPTGSYVMYPLKDFIAGIAYIQQNANLDAIVLSETTAGNYIPVYSGNRVYVGHDNTVNAEQKRADTRQFFAGAMSQIAGREFVRMTGASYIFFGPQEKEDGGVTDLARVYPFVHQVYQNPYVTVYRVR